MKNIYIFIVVVIVIGVVAYGYNQAKSDVDVENSLTMTDDKQGEDFKSMEVDNNQYVDYEPALLAQADSGDVVLFFHASWCPTCRVLDENLKDELGDFPNDLTILKVNYDKEKELKKKYSITYQHTLVQVDSQGNELAKWAGSNDLSAILKKLK
ncbi:thioredoxin family protein [Candidatus Parcubacteria bacterium]|jgi:thioredoxin 1|nr:thioredoxin family protein [Candidatus Parcubacteria bacterium]